MADSVVNNQPPPTPPEIDSSAPLPESVDLEIINLDKVLLETKALSVILPVPYGNLALLAGHTPIFTKLTKGTVTVNQLDGKSSKFDIENGIAKATQYKITILVGF